MNKIQSTLDGMLNVLVNTNFGDSRITNLQIERTINKPSFVENQFFYATGFLLGIAAEGGLFAYSLYELIKGNYGYLLGYGGIKLAARSPKLVDSIRKELKDKFSSKACSSE